MLAMSDVHAGTFASAGGEYVLDAIARRLHEVMERLDPTDDPEWDSLTDDRREFYRQCVKEVLHETASVVGSRMPATTWYMGPP
jgi:hypothetical protein